MTVYAMADLHLSTTTNKPMDVFGDAWENYHEKIKNNWPLSEEDIIVIPGDISWAMSLEELKGDFEFLSSLPGTKIIGKGNHDYWWSTLTKLRSFAKKYNNILFLHNNSFEVGGYSICGTRGWVQESSADNDTKIIAREVKRLELSLKSATAEPIVFMHYPPLYGPYVSQGIMDMLKKYDIKKCYYGHLHSHGINNAVCGNVDGIDFQLISADYLNFKPVKVFETETTETCKMKLES